MIIEQKLMLKKEAPAIAIEPRRIEVIIAVLVLIFPEAMGLNFFAGCFLSFSQSIMSFIRYTALAAIENKKKASTVLVFNGLMNNFFPNISGKKINIFFIQCFGRIAINMCFMKTS